MFRKRNVEVQNQLNQIFKARSNSIPIPQSPHFFWSVLNSERGLLVLISRNKNSYSLTETLDNLFGKSMNF